MFMLGPQERTRELFLIRLRNSCGSSVSPLQSRLHLKHCKLAWHTDRHGHSADIDSYGQQQWASHF